MNAHLQAVQANGSNSSKHPDFRFANYPIVSQNQTGPSLPQNLGNSKAVAD
ncbi:hypothetical protein ABIF29_004001 [Bradyrhizobium elkanii]|uniref:Uncharacterized protein n=1 Tax=Bradyrhizobium elkanii TaxID=29448 RepID=A0ABV4F191_BRAEL|nr:hypothetical protein [Bradyrhizobium elkanii]MCP1983538.1 hypothetical protein [Bradyrhizobium elkanii]MCS3881481.1 hypothetical protein [Bradyrhizobium elkanii]MCS4219467.1 hypothetical protein [Bradyrhizobium elkanii]MCW2200428.1 hypothetical protein [Bradyrhizobium elkanii]